VLTQYANLTTTREILRSKSASVGFEQKMKRSTAFCHHWCKASVENDILQPINEKRKT
jgi:hypothetical protein